MTCAFVLQVVFGLSLNSFYTLVNSEYLFGLFKLIHILEWLLVMDNCCNLKYAGIIL